MIYLRGAKREKNTLWRKHSTKVYQHVLTTQLLTPSQSVQRSLLQSSELPLVYQRLPEDSPVLLPLPNWTDQILVAPDLPCKHNGRGHWARSEGKLGNCLSFSLKTCKFQFKSWLYRLRIIIYYLHSTQKGFNKYKLEAWNELRTVKCHSNDFQLLGELPTRAFQATANVS